MLHGIPGSGWKSLEFYGFRWDSLATRIDKEKPRRNGAKSLIFLEKELVAGARNRLYLLLFAKDIPRSSHASS